MPTTSATLPVGDVFLKIDADQARIDVEVEAMAMAPIPTPEALWRKPPVLALAALPGTALGHHGEPSATSSARGPRRVRPHGRCTTRRCRHGPVAASTSWHRNSTANAKGSSRTTSFLPDLVTHNRRRAETALRPWTPTFTHGDLQVAHVFRGLGKW